MKKTPLELQEKRYGGRRRGLKRLLGLAFFITLTLIGLALVADFRHKNPRVSPPAALPRGVNRRQSGVTFTSNERGRTIFILHAARTVSYGEGARMELEDVNVEIFGRDGNRRDEISTSRCQYNNETNALACFGGASIKLASEQGLSAKPTLEGSQPLFLETSDVRYDPSDFAVETPKGIRFQYGPASGTAVGLEYNTRTGALRLASAVTINLPEPRQMARRNRIAAVAAPIKLSAGGLFYDKRQITLHAPVRLTQGMRRLTATGAVVRLDAASRATGIAFSSVEASDELGASVMKGAAERLNADLDPRTNQVRRLFASGNVLIEGRQGGADGRSLRRLTAQNVTVEFAGPKAAPQAGEAEGDVKLVLVPVRVNPRPQIKADSSLRPAALRMTDHPEPPVGLATGARVLTASDVVFSFRPGGLIKEAHTRGHGGLDLLPRDAGGDTQSVAAQNLRMAFDTAGQVETIQGGSPVRLVDQPPAAPRGRAEARRNSEPRISTSDKLFAKLDAGQLASVEQTGNVNFQQGATRARADQAVYRADAQQVDLTGNPEMWEPDGRVRAQHIRIAVNKGFANAWGAVQSVYLGSPGGKPPGDGTDGGVIIVMADSMSADRQEQRAHYEGHVRTWRGPDVIEAPSLDVYRKQERLVAGEGVVTSLVEPSLVVPTSQESRNKTKSAASARAVQPVTIRARRLVYFNLGREAIYQGDVVMVSADTTFRADRLEVYFSEPKAASDSEIEKAIADGNVRVAQGSGRRASGDHAEYFAGSGKIVLTGGPPVIQDDQQGSLTGKRLTFFVRDASLFADGGTTSRTVPERRIPRR